MDVLGLAQCKRVGYDVKKRQGHVVAHLGLRWSKRLPAQKNGRPLQNLTPTTHGGFVAAVPSRAFRDGTGIFMVILSHGQTKSSAPGLTLRYYRGTRKDLLLTSRGSSIEVGTLLMKSDTNRPARKNIKPGAYFGVPLAVCVMALLAAG